MTAASLFDAPGHAAALSIIASRPAELRANPGLVAEAMRAMDRFRAELETLRTDPVNCRIVPEIEDFDDDPALAGRLLDDAGFIRSLAIRAAVHTVETAGWLIRDALAPYFCGAESSMSESNRA